MSSIYRIKRGEKPILISFPHSGVLFPEEIKQQYNSNLISAPDDTDWFVDQLYNFAEDMGITTIKALYSRWVIDLNRDPMNASLYKDGRIITELVPTKTFLGEPLYRGSVPNEKEIKSRLDKYYWPYHNKVNKLLEELKQNYPNILFFDAHSIRQRVHTIQSEPFPDLILGNNDGASCASFLTEIALKTLRASEYDVQYNKPFKGGYLTRSIGKPEKNIHALQLEMTKINYMDEETTNYDINKAKNIQTLLQKVFTQLVIALERE